MNHNFLYKFLVVLFSVIIIAYAENVPCDYGQNETEIDTYRAVKKLGDFITTKASVLENPSEVSIFYSVKDNHTIKDMMPRPWIKPGQSLRLPFIGDPCSCTNTSCGCCVGINITSVKFSKEACVNISYDQSIFGIIVDVYVDQQNVFHNVYSASNPPPICIPLIISGVPTGIDFCLRLYEIFLDGYNIHTCIDLEARIATAPVLILHFDCIKIGVDGVSATKPGGSPTTTTSTITTTLTTSAPVAGDIYDPVTETDGNKTNMTLIIQPTNVDENEFNMTETQTILAEENITNITENILNIEINNVTETIESENATINMNYSEESTTQIAENFETINNSSTPSSNVEENLINEINSGEEAETTKIPNEVDATSTDEYTNAINFVFNRITNLTQFLSGNSLTSTVTTQSSPTQKGLNKSKDSLFWQ